jgi:hypothetical protein
MEETSESGIFLFVVRRDERVPRHAGLRFEINGLARRGWNRDEMIALGTLNLPPGMLFVTFEMLVATRTREFEFTHKNMDCSFDVIVPFYASSRIFAMSNLPR